MNIEEIAKVAHEMNAAICAAFGDLSPPEWDDAPEWQRKSAITGVKFHLENPQALPEESHTNWREEKQKEGWTYGPEKDPEKKQHPCMVPFHELPPEQQAKDYLFRQIVHSLMNQLPV